MPYIVDDQEDKEKQEQGTDAGPQTVQQIGGSAELAGSSNAGGGGQGAPASKPGQGTSGQFNNFGAYLDKNKSRFDVATGIQQSGANVRNQGQQIENRYQDLNQQNTISQGDKDRTDSIYNRLAQGNGQASWAPTAYSQEGQQQQQNIQDRMTARGEEGAADLQIKNGGASDALTKDWDKFNQQYAGIDDNEFNYLKDQLGRTYQGERDWNQIEQNFTPSYTKDLQAYNERVNIAQQEAGQRQLLSEILGKNRTAGQQDLDYALFSRDQAQQDALRNEMAVRDELVNNTSAQQEAVNNALAALYQDINNYTGSINDRTQNQRATYSNTLEGLVDSFNQAEAERNAQKNNLLKNDALGRIIDSNYKNVANYQNTSTDLLQQIDALNAQKSTARFDPNSIKGKNGQQPTQYDIQQAEQEFYRNQQAQNASIDQQVAGLRAQQEAARRALPYMLQDEAYAPFGTYDQQMASLGNIDPTTAFAYNKLGNLLNQTGIENTTSKAATQGKYGVDTASLNARINALLNDYNNIYNSAPTRVSVSGGGRGFLGTGLFASSPKVSTWIDYAAVEPQLKAIRDQFKVWNR